MSSQDDRVRDLESKLEEALAAVPDLRSDNELLRARVVDRLPESTDTPTRVAPPTPKVRLPRGALSLTREPIHRP